MLKPTIFGITNNKMAEPPEMNLVLIENSKLQLYRRDRVW